VKNNLAAVEDADDQEAAKVILDEVDEDEEEFQEESDDDIEDKLTPLEQKSLSWFLEDQARTIAEEEAQKAEETRIRKLKEEAKAKANPPVLPKVRFIFEFSIIYINFRNFKQTSAQNVSTSG
jgi:hypothetical protein